MKKRMGFAAFLLAALMIFTLTACGSDTGKIDGADSETTAGKQVPTPEELKAIWEGVYESPKGVVVIRDAENGSLRFAVSMDGLSISATADIEGFSATYSDTEREILLAVSDDKMLLENESTEADTGEAVSFFEIFTRNDEDPYTFVIMREDEANAADAPHFDMTVSARYEDPKGRFTVTMPDIFDLMPEEAQPEDGIYKQTADGSVYIMVETMKKIAATEQELTEYLDGLGILAAVRPDGMVIYSHRFTDGTNDPWAEFAFMRILPDMIVKVSYVCAYELYDECSVGCSLISIEKTE